MSDPNQDLYRNFAKKSQKPGGKKKGKGNKKPVQQILSNQPMQQSSPINSTAQQIAQGPPLNQPNQQMIPPNQSNQQTIPPSQSMQQQPPINQQTHQIPQGITQNHISPLINQPVQPVQQISQQIPQNQHIQSQIPTSKPRSHSASANSTIQQVPPAPVMNQNLQPPLQPYIGAPLSNPGIYNNISQMSNDELRNEINRQNERIQNLETSFTFLCSEFSKLQSYVSSLIPQLQVPFNFPQTQQMTAHQMQHAQLQPQHLQQPQTLPQQQIQLQQQQQPLSQQQIQLQQQQQPLAQQQIHLPPQQLAQQMQSFQMQQPPYVSTQQHQYMQQNQYPEEEDMDDEDENDNNGNRDSFLYQT